MNNKKLFEGIDYENDPEWVIKEFYNSIYSQHKFLWALPFILKRYGCCVNETDCTFPDLDDPDPMCHFERIMFSVYGGEMIVPEFLGFNYVRLTCESYIKLHPDDQKTVNDLTMQIH
ncbi:ribonuclease toxin immunity protein CdiI [Kosakonia cowanii]|uniref:ribonuclease toxin immunity protein CdiI n=1 Tax=Kosakonia cowanii TaxID=208223 RepID=UPI0023F9E665|nr:ribonuclease toxin immunity protein CdiI [Kosakonia cowanii]MDF7758536.1 ribonuclease toxin immunity protein CdiI [Kosakonia cowanii]